MADDPNSKAAVSERVNKFVAITVALVSVFMAICKVKDDNVCQAMQEAKSRAVDTWNEYQAKKIKHHLSEESAFQLSLTAMSLSGDAKKAADAHREALTADVARYTKEEADLRGTAEGFEKKYDDLNFTDDQFDLSDAALSVALGMLAVAALTAMPGLLYFSWVFVALGFLMGSSGFFGLGVHPGWLIRLLS